MTSLYTYSSLIASIICVILSLFTYLKNRNRRDNRSFAILLLSIGIWTLFPYICGVLKDEDSILFISRLLYISAIFTPANFVKSISIVLNLTKTKRTQIIISTAYFTSLFFLPFIFTPLFIKGVNRFKPNFYVEPGPLYAFFILYFGLICLYTFISLLLGIKYSSGLKRNQSKYVFTGFFIAFIGGVLHVTAPYINIEYIPHDIFIIVFAMIITYAIVVLRLMDINVAIRKGIANLIIGLLLTCIVIWIFLLQISLVNRIAITLTISLLTSMYLPQVKFKLENLINQVLYGSRYDYQKTLIEISQIVPTIIDIDKLLRFIVETITKTMRIQRCAIFLKDDFSNRYIIRQQIGLGEDIKSISISHDNPLISIVKNIKDVFVRHEFIIKTPLSEEVCSILNRLDAEIVVPFNRGEIVIGLMTLSNRSGGDTFSHDDFRLLRIIANQCAVAIENIKLFNKLIHADRQTFLETLASGVSHEMRNRLVAIRTFINLFPERVNLNYVEKEFIEFRELAVREMARLIKIIDGLLSYSRAVTIGGETLNINDLIDEALLIIQPKLRDKEINVVTSLDKGISTMTGDKGRLLQVFINIIQNGIDAMRKGGRLEISSKDKGEEVEVSITDNGKGIPKEHLDAIFEPFFTTKHNGTGLGLSIVQRIVRDHSGRIEVASEVGKGTTFTITFNKKGGYRPGEITPKEGLGYWDVKKEVV